MRKGLQARIFAWWYFSIAAGFLLLAVNRLLLGERWPLVWLRFTVSAGFFLLGWLTLRQNKR